MMYEIRWELDKRACTAKSDDIISAKAVCQALNEVGFQVRLYKDERIINWQ